MKVLVTGADGFIGSHLTELLVKKGYQVRSMCMYTSMGTKGWLDTIDKEIHRQIDTIIGDIRDYSCVRDAARDCDIIFHLAALIGIPYSYKAPRSYVETNIIGTMNILEAAKDFDAKLIHTSTSETYGTAQSVPISESHPLNAQSPYSATKIGADQLAISYHKSFNTRVCILRPFNTYGPRQSQRAVIPSIINQLINGNSELKLGDVTPTRDFSYVEDTCKAFEAVASSQSTEGEVINCASNFEVSIKETVDIISNIMGKEYRLTEDKNRIRPDTSEVRRLYGCNKKLTKLTNWVPDYSGRKGFEKGLINTVKWFANEKNQRFYNDKTGYTI